MVKKSIALLLAASALLAMVACGAKEDGASSAGSASSLSEKAPASSPASASSSGAALAAPAGVSPLTGLAAPEGMVEGQRPVAVTVMNSRRSLPQRGLAAADVLVEMPIDSGETRLLALYGDYRNVPSVGPVSSTYDQLVQVALPLDAIQVHIDKSQYAENLLAVLGQKDIDGIHLGTTAFWFDESRQLPRLEGKLNEYCWYTDAGLIWNGMTALDVAALGRVPALFTFGAQDAYPQQQTAVAVLAVFGGDFVSGFYYNAAENLYHKHSFWAAHVDDDGTPLRYDNVLLLSTNIGQKHDSDFLEFDFAGGAGWYFTAGGVTEIRWEKGDVQQPLLLTDMAGKPLAVKPGKTYIGFVPAAQENGISWQNAEEWALAQAQ